MHIAKEEWRAKGQQLLVWASYTRRRQARMRNNSSTNVLRNLTANYNNTDYASTPPSCQAFISSQFSIHEPSDRNRDAVTVFCGSMMGKQVGNPNPASANQPTLHPHRVHTHTHRWTVASGLRLPVPLALVLVLLQLPVLCLPKVSPVLASSTISRHSSGLPPLQLPVLLPPTADVELLQQEMLGDARTTALDLL